MSEYQYYEFQAIDRPLTAEEREQVGRLSSRTHPTATHAVFTYSYSDFRGDPLKLLADYYDVLLYMANWGSRRLVFRLPRALVDVDVLMQYGLDYYITLSLRGDYLLIDIDFSEEEGGDWIEGEGWLSSLALLRHDLLQGDFRALYLAWLKGALFSVDYEEDLDTDTMEPFVPTNLHDLSAPLQAFVHFFEIGDDLLAVAAEASTHAEDKAEMDLDHLITRLSEEERNAFLLRLARGEAHLDLQLVRRLREVSRGQQHSRVPGLATGQRTVGELRDAVEEQGRRRKEQKRIKAEQARRRRLEELAQTEPHLWEDVVALIEGKKTTAYADAVKILVELRTLAEYRGELIPFKERVRRLQETYSRRSALRTRLEQAGLLQDRK